MKTNKYNELKLHYKIWFTDQNEKGILGDENGRYLRQ